MVYLCLLWNTRAHESAFANWARETVEKTDASREIAESTSNPIIKKSKNERTNILDGTDVTRPIAEGMNALDILNIFVKF